MSLPTMYQMPRFIYRRVLFLLLQHLSTCTSALVWKLVWVLMADVTRDIGYNNCYSNERNPSSVTVLLSEEVIFRYSRNNGGGFFPLLNGLQMLLNDRSVLFFILFNFVSRNRWMKRHKAAQPLSLCQDTHDMWHLTHFAPFITYKHLPSQNLFFAFL